MTVVKMGPKDLDGFEINFEGRNYLSILNVGMVLTQSTVVYLTSEST